jgi:hypothetical protein
MSLAILFAGRTTLVYRRGLNDHDDQQLNTQVAVKWEISSWHHDDQLPMAIHAFLFERSRSGLSTETGYDGLFSCKVKEGTQAM